jgi:hypothetical protein
MVGGALTDETESDFLAGSNVVGGGGGGVPGSGPEGWPTSDSWRKGVHPRSCQPAAVKGSGGGGGGGGEGVRAFQLLTEKDMLCVGSEEQLTALLGCAATARVKVVSIYGNTGDGK